MVRGATASPENREVSPNTTILRSVSFWHELGSNTSNIMIRTTTTDEMDDSDSTATDDRLAPPGPTSYWRHLAPPHLCPWTRCH